MQSDLIFDILFCYRVHLIRSVAGARRIFKLYATCEWMRVRPLKSITCNLIWGRVYACVNYEILCRRNSSTRVFSPALYPTRFYSIRTTLTVVNNSGIESTFWTCLKNTYKNEICKLCASYLFGAIATLHSRNFTNATTICCVAIPMKFYGRYKHLLLVVVS